MLKSNLQDVFKTSRLKTIVAAILMSFTSTANAGQFPCSGVPIALQAWSHAGYVSVQLSGHSKAWILCQVDTQPGCNAVLGLLQQAKATGSHVMLAFQDTTYKTCDALPEWNPELIPHFDYLKLAE